MRRSTLTTSDSTSDEMLTGRRRKTTYRTAIVTAVVIAAFSLSLSSCSTLGTTAACSKGTGTLIKPSGSTLSKGLSSTTLPPSHDNDAGEGRIPDVTPDADVDANQRPHACSSPK